MLLQVNRMDPRWACLTLFLVLLADTARGQGCGLSAFRHVPGTHCRGDVVDRPNVGSADACAQACCDNPACKSFQYSTHNFCLLISKICTDEEKLSIPHGNMYDRIQGEAKPQASAGCGLSAFQHVPQTHCPGYENLVDRPQVGSVEACAKACCNNPACKSFQYSIHNRCYLISKICSDEEKKPTPMGNMYDRIQDEAKPQASAGCGLSAFQHVPQTHCPGYENLVDRPQVGSADACAKACCNNPACKSFQYSIHNRCYLISKICSDEEKKPTPMGNMYDRIQGPSGPRRVCEHQRLSISCPAGQQINIVSALYGRTTRAVCPSGPIRTTNCRSSTSLARVRASCQGKSTCSMAASNGVFGDPCVGTYKYLEVSSTCILAPPAVPQGPAVAPPASRAPGCGLSAFRHVPRTHCSGRKNYLSRHKAGSADACAKACCDNPDCKSFQYSIHKTCFLINKICTDEEKKPTPIGNMYDRIQGEAKPQASAGCGLSAFRHVPRTHCSGRKNYLSRSKAGSADACSKACCDNPDCKSFQYSIHKTCFLINKICTDEEKISTPIGNMYDRIQAGPSGTRRVCENQRLSISCPAGQQINIVSALYGRTTRAVCPSGPIRTIDCLSSTSLTRVRTSCQGKSTCSMAASNGVFGDPCVGTHKYLEVSSTCIPGPSGTRRVCENQRLSISCPAGQQINIVSALYGRTTRAVCPSGPIRTTNCRSSTSLARVRTSCQGKSTCSVSASNSVFGDPCVGTHKYLEVSSTCIPSKRMVEARETLQGLRDVLLDLEEVAEIEQETRELEDMGEDVGMAAEDDE
ncbi:uncharacterized protein LOC118412625 isoform X3 [Branchiostoma floridae]|uniref:Uncharacterized protein LOC118412625 isoform X3 n=1 Tax=Branchiostoma floridae TaxID=7739 RepID=A0A9J7KVV3_BRAFL|nr:uncharacterized protein LOC118412625 isoform X3 [Branchiostoma floridae]